MMGYVRKSISIREDQNEWLKEHSINLSRLVQRALDQLMKGEKEPSFVRRSLHRFMRRKKK